MNQATPERCSKSSTWRRRGRGLDVKVGSVSRCVLAAGHSGACALEREPIVRIVPSPVDSAPAPAFVPQGDAAMRLAFERAMLRRRGGVR